MNQELELLNELFVTAEIGKQSIEHLTPKATDEKMCEELSKEKNYYVELKTNAEKKIEEAGGKIDTLSKVNSWMRNSMIKLNSLFDDSESHIAEMMVQGTNMGIIAITKLSNKYDENLAPDVKEMAKTAIDNMRGYVDSMLSFL